MADETRISGPVSIKTDSASRVAYDLMIFIGNNESGDKAHRDYWLSLYRQCYKATHGATLKHVLDKGDGS